MGRMHSKIAAVLSWFIPGLGQIYSEHFGRGFALYFISYIFFGCLPLMHFIGVNYQYIALIIIVLILIAYKVFVSVDAYKTYQETDKPSSGRLIKWAKFVFICILLIAIDSTISAWRNELTGFKPYKIPSGAMEPTLLIGDHIYADLWRYRNHPPQRGDVIIFEYPEDPSKNFIERVVAVEGEQIRIQDKKVFIDGKQLEDTWGVYRDPNVISGGDGEMSRDNFGPVTVPPRAVFVMGDNRDKSFDSRFWGYVDLDKVKGRALYIYWSWEGFFKGIRWNRIGKLIN